MMHDDPLEREPATLRAVRRFLLAILLIGFAGTLTELFLLGHDEDACQLIPIALLSAGILAAAWTAVRPSGVAVRVFQAMMMLLIAAAGVGLVLHYRANVEFQLELDPSLARMPLFWKVMAAKAPPALAPGILAQLGLVGLAYSHRHPARHCAVHRRQEGGRGDAFH